MQINLKNIVLFCCFVVFSQHLFALQLGDIKVNSTQDQKLNASIKLTLSDNESLDDLNPSVASKEAYISRSIDRFDIHSDIKMIIKKTAKGAVLLLSSNLLVKDPFIDLLIQIDSSKGRNYAEYTVLLDPPPPGQEIKKEESKPAPKAVEKPAPKAVEKPAPKAVEKPAPKAVERKNVKSKAGQTLYQIARNNKPSKVTVEQMVVAIFQINPKSFAKSNLNGLLVGQNLELPKENYFESLSHFEARKIMREQNKEWKLLRTKTQPKKISTSNNVSENKIKLLEQELAETKRKLLEKTNKITEKQKSEVETNIPKKKAEPKKAEPKKAEPKKAEPKKAEPKKLEVISGDEKQKDEREPELNQAETFKSSISDPKDDIINEVIIKDEENKKELSTLHMLLLTGLLVSLIGLLVTLSRRRRAKQTLGSKIYADINSNKDEDDDILSSLQSGREFIDLSDKDEYPSSESISERPASNEQSNLNKDEDKT
jgi:FimV-like protein